MRQKSIVIRSQPDATFDHAGPSLAAEALGAETRPSLTRLDIDEFTPAEAARTSRHADVLAVAPELPTVLIEPMDAVESDFELESQVATSTWGVEAVGANSSPLDGSGIVAAVLDTGIDTSHPAFAGMNIDEIDYSGDGNGDINGHGTHCAGTVFGQDVGGTRIGVARGIERAMVAKVLGNSGSGSTLWSLQAIQWALNGGANVISMSLGIDFPGYVRRLEDSGMPTELAVNLALEGYRATIVAYQSLAAFTRSINNFGNSCVIVAAGGNESKRNDNEDWEISASLPSATSGILSVGALGKTSTGHRVASFSNTGVNVAAPGVGVLSARAGASDLRSLNGTSMATPHVSGVACLWSEWLLNREQLSPFNVEAKLAASATTETMVSGFDSADVGLGLVSAPENA